MFLKLPKVFNKFVQYHKLPKLVFNFFFEDIKKII